MTEPTGQQQETSIVNEGATQGQKTYPAYMAQFPDALKTNELIGQHKTLGDLGKAYLDLHAKTEKAVIIPGENATKEEIEAYYNKTGRPENPDAYKLPTIEGFSETESSQAIDAAFKAKAHELGLDNKKAAELYKWYGELALTTVKSRQQQTDKLLGDLKAEWGGNYDANMGIVSKAFKQFGGEELAKYFDETQAGKNPVVIKAFLEIGKAMLDDGIVNGSLSNSTPKKGIFYNNSPELYKK